MRTPRLLRIERDLIAAEYLIDSTNSHVRKVKCDDVKPLALRRYSNALNKVRAAIILIRLETGVRHPTLFAGTAGGNIGTGFERRKQKAWGSKRPHGWAKDCLETKR